LLAVAAAAVAFIFFPTACDAWPFEENPAFQIAESHIQISYSFFGPNDVFWLDNRALVFAGAENGPEPWPWPKPDASQVLFPDAKARIYIWRMGEEPRVYQPAKWPKRGTRLHQNYLCAAGGKITYSSDGFAENQAVPIMTGSPGKERPASMTFVTRNLQYFPFEFRTTDLELVNRSCDQIFAPKMAGHRWVPSHSEAVALDFGPVGQPEMAPVPLTIASLTGEKNVPVRGVDPNAIVARCTSTLPWEDDFVVWGCPDTWKKHPEVISVWKIRKDGSSERTDIHVGHLILNNLLPFRNGYYLWVTGTKGDEPGTTTQGAGLYLVRGGQLHQILSGFMMEPRAISPDGCLAAFAKNTALYAISFRQHLVVYDLCKAAKM
jgi:hypothetical protein